MKPAPHESRAGTRWLLVLVAATAGCGIFTHRYRPEPPESREERLAAFLRDRFETFLDLYPSEATRLGLRRGLRLWDETGAEAVERERAMARLDLRRLEDDFPSSSLSGAARRDREQFARRLANPELPVAARDLLERLELVRSLLLVEPRTLLLHQRTATLDEYEAHLARLGRVAGQIDALRERLGAAAEAGPLPSRCALERAIERGRWLTSGAPFQSGAGAPVADGPLAADLRRRALALPGLEADEAALLIERGQQLLRTSFGPAVGRLLATLERLTVECADDGLTAFEGGPAAYAHRVARETGTNLAPERAHDRCLIDTADLRASLAQLAREVGRVTRQTDDEDAIGALRSERWIAPPAPDGSPSALPPVGGEAASAAGGQTASPAPGELASPARGETGAGARGETAAGVRGEVAHPTHGELDPLRERLYGLFARGPASARAVGLRMRLDFELIDATPLTLTGPTSVLALPAPLDGARPARLAIDADALVQLPRWRLLGLLLSEGEPGRLRFQGRARGDANLPAYRRASTASALGDGWGFYVVDLMAAAAPREDAEARLAGLGQELWGAALAAADTGVHTAGWTRERARDYLRTQTPWPERELERGLDSIYLEPGRAYVAREGLATIRGLLREAEASLGARFSLTSFHAALLAEGGLPLDLAKEAVREWIVVTKG